MKWKIILISLVLLFSLSLVWAENNTTNITEIEDTPNYISPVAISDNGIEFSDDFIGFCIDLTKGDITTSDKYTVGGFGNSGVENNIKLAIIECYKQGKENNINSVVSQVMKGDNSIIKDVSSEKIGSSAVVEINNDTEATFEFEFLKSSDDAKSDCVAYKVSMKPIEKQDALAIPGEDSNDKQTDDTDSDNQNDDEKQDKTNDTNPDNTKTDDQEKQESDTNQEQENTDKQDKSDDTNKDDAKSTENNKTNENKDTIINETNKTIVNKTKTVIVNENNTTIINQNNVKTINNTTQTPQNNTTTDLLKTAGNPIFILIIVIIVIVIAVAVTRRKD